MSDANGVNFFGDEEEKKSETENRQSTDGQNKKLFKRERRKVIFGEWPQSIKSENVDITENIDGRGFYLGSDGEYYAKVKANPYYNGYSFSNDTEIKKDKTYYFKVEPLSWAIIKEDSNRLLIHCNNIIFNKAYQMNYDLDNDGDIVTDFNDAPPDTYASNYIYSEIRAWLLNDFLSIIEKAPNFDSQKIKILPYKISDDAAPAFFDRVFLLSKSEVENFGVGYKTHMRIATDYAKASGAYVYGAMSGVKSRASGKGWWWLRTPCASEGQDTVHAIDQNGVTNYAWIWVKGYGIVPAIYIEVNVADG